MPIIRYVGETDSLVRSFGTKVPVSHGSLVEVSEAELESLRNSGYKKYFAGTVGTAVAEVEPESGEETISSRVAQKPETAIPTKREMLEEIAALGVEITPEIKKMKSEEIFAELSKFREQAQKPETASEPKDENAPETDVSKPEDTKAGEELENAPTGEENANEAQNAEGDAPETASEPKA